MMDPRHSDALVEEDRSRMTAHVVERVRADFSRAMEQYDDEDDGAAMVDAFDVLEDGLV